MFCDQPLQHVQDDFPEVAVYLGSTDHAAASTATRRPSQHEQNSASERLMSSLMGSVGDIVERAVADGRDADEALTEAVRRAVLEGVAIGYGMTRGEDSGEETGSGQRKRTRRE